MGKRGIALFLALICLGFHVTPLDAQANHLARYREARYVMGTILEITLYHHDAREARKYLDESFSLAQRLDEILSNYKPESEVNRLNQTGGRGKVRVSPELYELLLISKELTLKTGGAFDITVGPLLELWQAAKSRGQPPSFRLLRKTQTFVGMEKVVLYPALEVELKQQGIRIDTGGIGKGYAVDRMIRLLGRWGISSALINFGHSSVYAIGSPPGSNWWKLLLQFPGQPPLGIVKLKDQAFSASDSLGRPFEIEGKRYGHLIDPQSGLPMTRKLQAVVLAPSAAVAEGLTKYLILRGCDKKRKFDRRIPFEALLIGERGQVQCSEGFPLIPLTLD